MGGYDQKLAGCSYNQNGVTLSVDGVKANEVKATYTDATGNHVEALDLKTLQTRELPQQKYLTP